jgi:hyperosmotically inducible protein
MQRGKKMKTIKSGLVMLAVILALTSSAIAATTGKDDHSQVVKRVQHELVTLPYFGVFDNLAYKVEGDRVTLYGQVVRPTTKSDAGNRVARIPGVGSVVNNIQVLPLSSFDDAIRARTYRAVFSRGSLYRYAMGANPSVHIIVNGGRVTLEGVVANKGEQQLAYAAASSVPGVFAVTNNLRLENGSEAY